MPKPPPEPARQSYVGAWIATLLLIVAFVFGLLLFPPYFDDVPDLGEPPATQLFLGRFHPILVHLPAGILIFVCALELLCLRRKMEEKYGAAAFLALWMASAGSVMAVIAGILLSREGGYGRGTMNLHQGLAIIGTAGILLGLVMRLTGMATANRGLVDGYRAVLFFSFGLMGIGAHFGANMTHGNTYLTKYAPPEMAEKITGMEKWMLSLVEKPKMEAPAPVPAPAPQAAPNPAPAAAPVAAGAVPLPAPAGAGAAVTTAKGAVVPGGDGKLVFEHLILPLLEQKCNSCHNEDKSKGGLRMDSYDLTMQGGDSGDNVIPGKPDDSLTIQRIMLPEDDDEHMPPEGKDQLTPAEVELLRWWIEQGASNTMTVNDTPFPEAAKTLVEELLAKPTAMRESAAQPAPAFAATAGHWLKIAAVVALTSAVNAADEAKGPPPALQEAVKKVEAAGASLLPVAAGSTSYRFTALNVAKEFGDAGLDALAPVAENIVALDLARTQVSDAGLAKVAAMTQLKELRLDNTGISDAGLDHLAGLSQLEYLNLYGSKVTDGGIQKLAGLKSLKALYVWQTGVTKAGVAQLRGKAPQLYVNNGWTAEDDAKPVAAAAQPEAKPAEKAPVPAAALDPKALAGLVIYKDVVAPILAAKCQACHGEEKAKGKLKMHTFADLLKGGSEGDVNVIAGKAADSLMMQRIALPVDDDEHMPPEDEDQLTKEEVALLTWWINEGASETQTIEKAKRSAEIDGALAVVLKGKAAPAAAVAAKAEPKPVTPTKPAPAAKPAAAPAAAGLDPAKAGKAIVYNDIIAPILAEKCQSCHGEEKSKGKLKLHTFADIQRGGSEGDANLVPGKSGDSLLIQRILLPADDDEHMPPEDEPQITPEELALLKWWIDNGASESETVAAAKKTPEIEGLLAVVLTRTPAKPAEVVKKEEKPKPAAMSEAQKKQVAEISAKLQGLNATLMPLAQDTEQLRLSVINAADKFGDKELALLAPIADQILWLDLARSQITDAGLDTIAQMPYLERLHLENTKVGDAGIAKLGTLPALAYLNLYGTKVTDGGIAKLAGAKSLQKLFVWQTGVTQAGAKTLEGKVPGLIVNVGLSEAEIAKLTAPPPEPPKVEEKKPDAKPAPPAKKPEEKKPAAAKPAPAKKEEEKKADVPPAAKPKANAAPNSAAEPKKDSSAKPKSDSPPAKQPAKPGAKTVPKAA